jgi:hypothetical protein
VTTVAHEHAVVNCYLSDRTGCVQAEVPGLLYDACKQQIMFAQPCITIMQPAVAVLQYGQHASLAGTPGTTAPELGQRMVTMQPALNPSG